MIEINRGKCFFCKSDIKITKWKDRNRENYKKFCSSSCRGKQTYIDNNKYYREYQRKLPKGLWKVEKECEVCKNVYMPKSGNSKTCSKRCSKKRWKILNPEKNREINNLSTKRCRERDPERYRFYTKQRRHKIRESSEISSKKFNREFKLSDWEDIKELFNHTCPICLKFEPDIKLTIDHIIPLSKGGKHSIENIQPLCHSCNSRKKDKLN